MLLNQIGKIYNKKKTLFIVIPILSASLGISVQSLSVSTHYLTTNEPQYLPIEAHWCLSIGECILLEIADTQHEKITGMQMRNEFPSGRGMWFKYPKPEIVKFWMKNTLISLDMVFISNKVVIHLEENVPICYLSPCKLYGPMYKVDGVIELLAGEIKRLQIKKGDKVNINVY